MAVPSQKSGILTPSNLAIVGAISTVALPSLIKLDFVFLCEKIKGTCVS